MKRPRADWKALREQLWVRSRGLCEVSGKPLDFEAFDAHHRRSKGMGGTSRPDTDTLPNLLALDPIVHNGGPGSVHAMRKTRSEHFGWLLPKLSEQPLHLAPVLVAVTHRTCQWVLLAENGLYVLLGAEAMAHVFEPGVQAGAARRAAAGRSEG